MRQPRETVPRMTLKGLLEGGSGRSQYIRFTVNGEFSANQRLFYKVFCVAMSTRKVGDFRCEECDWDQEISF